MRKFIRLNHSKPAAQRISPNKMNTFIIKLKQVFPIFIIVGSIIIAGVYLRSNRFAFSPTPQNGQIGGINGVYVREDFGSCGEYIHSYQVFRFYDDGTVLYTPLCLDGDVIDDWADIKQWFHRNTDKEIN